MRRTTGWVVGTLVAALAIAGVGYWGYRQYRETQDFKYFVTINNQRSFYNLLERVQKLEVGLAKTMATNTQQGEVMMLSDIWHQAAVAVEDLGAMPVRHATLDRTHKFLNQLGDFALALQKKTLRGLPLSAEDWAKLADLHQQAGNLAVQLQKVSQEVAGGIISWGDIRRGTRRVEGQGITATGTLDTIEKELDGVPTLLYDGPFSDHLEERSPKQMVGVAISDEQAKRLAQAFAARGTGDNLQATAVGEVNMKLAAYSVTLQRTGDKSGANINVDLTKQGGHPLQMIDNRAVGQPTLSLEQAVDRARKFLEDNGFSDMMVTDAAQNDGSATVTFVWKQGEVLVYPDMIKVTVGLDDGRVTAFDGRAYIMSHITRPAQMLQPELSKDEIIARLHQGFQVQHVRLAIIPTDGGGEALAWEVRGTIGENTFIIYYNAKDASLERIFQVITTESGTLQS
ncbi:MAG: germination protein YpeB [Bacillota bacterium]